MSVYYVCFCFTLTGRRIDGLLMRNTVPTRADDHGLYDRTIRVAVWPPTTRLFQKKLTPDLSPPAYDATCHGDTKGTDRAGKLPQLPWDVIRLIVRELCSECVLATEASSTTRSLLAIPTTLNHGSVTRLRAPGKAESPPKYAEALRSLYRDVSQLSLVSRGICRESRGRLFRTVDITKLPMRDTKLGLANFFGSTSDLSLASNIQILHLKAITSASSTAGIIRSCTNLSVLELDVKDTQKEECLIECLQGAIVSSTRLRELYLCGINSVKSISVALSLPYRLQVLSLEGFKERMGNLWNNPYDWINTEELHLSKCIFSDWDFHFFGALCGQHNATGPSLLKLSSTVVDFAKSNRFLLDTVTEAHLLEVQQMLKLDLLTQFTHLRSLQLSSRHEFVTLDRGWPELQTLNLATCTQSICKLLARFLGRNLLPGLCNLVFAKHAFSVAVRDKPTLQTLCDFEDALRDRPSIQVAPCYPTEGFARSPY